MSNIIFKYKKLNLYILISYFKYNNNKNKNGR